MSKYLEFASRLAIQNVDEGGQPFDACIVYQGEIIAEGVNEIHLRNDISAHAELIAIVKAQRHLNTIDLSGCTLYASGQPCPMCLGAIAFANIKEVYYNNTLQDATDVKLALSEQIYNFIQDKPTTLDLKLIHEKIDINPMGYYKDKGKR